MTRDSRVLCPEGPALNPKAAVPTCVASRAERVSRDTAPEAFGARFNVTLDARTFL
jgi:hypothetical protein